jgi:acyl dehydratase
MPINADAVGSKFAAGETTWTSKDCLLYALAVGAGVTDPTRFELEFTTENAIGLSQRVLPTFPVVVPVGGDILGAIGDFDSAMLLHGEQAVALHAPIPVTATVSGVTTITGIYDKGSGAVVVVDTAVSDSLTGTPIWTTTASLFIRGEGGFGGDRGPSNDFEIPDKAPDHTVTYSTRRDQALLYRLCGDRNPLHSDPRFAALAGFDKPILHGLCTFGFTGRALLHTLCGSDPERFLSISARFSKPVFPGQDLTVSMWVLGSGEALYRTSTSAGVVIDGGRLTYR